MTDAMGMIGGIRLLKQTREQAMENHSAIKIEDVRYALDKLDDLCRSEYPGFTIEALLTNGEPISRLRMQRLAGIALKRPFADEGPPRYSETRAQHSWPWVRANLELEEKQGTPEYKLLNELRLPGPWQPPREDGGPSGPLATWDALIYDAESERGLFKILALYVVDKLNDREPKTLREYLDAKESRRFEAGLDLAQLVFEATVTTSVASIVGVPIVAVGVALIGIQFGFRVMTDPKERHADNDGTKERHADKGS